MNLNLPNKLTLLRVILIPFFIAALMATPGAPGMKYPAVIIFAAACITDTLDGHIARSRDLVTNFGKFMDPLADKLLVCSALICFIELGRLPAWIVIVIVAREFIISGFRLVASDRGVVIAASKWGKSKTISQMVTIILLILDFPALRPVTDIFIVLMTVLTVVSLADYIVKNKDVLKED